MLVEIYDVSETEEVNEKWPYVQSIYILTSVDKSTVENWNNILKADGPCEGFDGAAPDAAPEIEQGHKVWQIMWD